MAKFISIFVALACASSLAACKSEGVRLVNSHSSHQEATGDLQDMVNLAGQTVGGDVLSKGDKQGADAHRKLAMTSPAKVIK